MTNLVSDLVGDITTGQTVRSMRGIIETVSEAYDVQDAVVAHLGPFCGRKIAMNAPPLLAAAGLDAPLVGQISGTASLTNGATLPLADYAELAIEPEFAVVLAKDVPEGVVLDRENYQPYVSRFVLAFEVLDKRNAGPDLYGPTFIANNIFNAGVVLATEPLDVSALDAGDYSALFLAAGEAKVDGQNTAPQNPIDALFFVINHFSARGMQVKAGETILCGAHYPPLTITAAGEYEFSLSSGEAVNLSISN